MFLYVLQSVLQVTLKHWQKTFGFLSMHMCVCVGVCVCVCDKDE